MGVLATRGADDGDDRLDLQLSGEPVEPTSDPGDDEDSEIVAIDLSDWPARRRAVLVERLELVEMPHRWEGDEVLVAAADGAWIDRLMDQVDDEAGLELDDGMDRLGYDLSDWSPADVERLVEVLADELVPHALDGDELVVHAVDELHVDAIVDAVLDPDRPAEATDPGAELLSELFLALNRLGREPEDNDARERLVQTHGRLDPQRPPYGIEPGTWRTLRDAVGELVEMTGHDPTDFDAVAQMAGALRDQLRPLV